MRRAPLHVSSSRPSVRCCPLRLTMFGCGIELREKIKTGRGKADNSEKKKQELGRRARTRDEVYKSEEKRVGTAEKEPRRANRHTTLTGATPLDFERHSFKMARSVFLLALCATLLLLLASFGSARVQAAASSEAASDVVVLTDSNFDELTATGSWIIEFYGGAHTRTRQETTGGMRTEAHSTCSVVALSLCSSVVRSVASRQSARAEVVSLTVSVH